ncbi:DUF3027 family protein [Rhodoglobus vestalii]|uniref:DUF3027 family protein n=1 Tax=Rhodoglobus vestalii TaxID=193384 RepID=A0A8H2PUL1_9MICO|nr:DUF3027 domain-containing protein [Rhodoglobus vestalii]TQO20616.1 DUF3027 family protein [Rhodoglobus vestalii]
MLSSRYDALARGALLEITDTASIGALAGEQVESDGTVSVIFASAMRGYPGWNWTVSIAHVEGAEPTVLEAELMPAEGALLSPDWVPWSERLADYKAAQAATEAADVEKAAADEAAGQDDDDDDLDHDDDDDDDDYDSGIFRGGDHDGVNVDDLDEPDDDDDGLDDAESEDDDDDDELNDDDDDELDDDDDDDDELDDDDDDDDDSEEDD